MPASVTPDTVNVTFPVLVRIIDWPADCVPVLTVPKLRVVADKVASGIPVAVPERVMVWVAPTTLLALSVITTLAVVGGALSYAIAIRQIDLTPRTEK